MAIAANLSTANSALTANVRRVDAIANNLANLSTEDYRPRDVRTVSAATVSSPPSNYVGGGVLTAVVEEEGPVDAATEYTRLIQARSAYGMALQTLRASDALSGELLRLSA